MGEPELPQLLAAGAALLLRPPQAVALTALCESRGIELDPVRARQDFYDALCVPQSGRYIPPYAHVLAQARVRDGGWWYFPPPRFDGGDVLAPWYQAVGFDPMQLDVDPMVKGPHRPQTISALFLPTSLGWSPPVKWVASIWSLPIRS